MAKTEQKTNLTVGATVNAPVAKVWEYWTDPKHITQWNNASDDWHTPRAENNLKVGGKFNFRMESKDGKLGFDFNGIYDNVTPNAEIAYTIADGRRVTIFFKSSGNETKVSETFETENMNSMDMQRTGWQCILNNFKKYVEANQ